MQHHLRKFEASDDTIRKEYETMRLLSNLARQYAPGEPTLVRRKCDGKLGHQVPHAAALGELAALEDSNSLSATEFTVCILQCIHMAMLVDCGLKMNYVNPEKVRFKDRGAHLQLRFVDTEAREINDDEELECPLYDNVVHLLSTLWRPFQGRSEINAVSAIVGSVIEDYGRVFMTRERCYDDMATLTSRLLQHASTIAASDWKTRLRCRYLKAVIYERIDALMLEASRIEEGRFAMQQDAT